jgi:hypothetical protein
MRIKGYVMMLALAVLLGSIVAAEGEQGIRRKP